MVHSYVFKATCSKFPLIWIAVVLETYLNTNSPLSFFNFKKPRLQNCTHHLDPQVLTEFNEQLQMTTNHKKFFHISYGPQSVFSNLASTCVVTGFFFVDLLRLDSFSLHIFSIYFRKKDLLF